MYPHQTDRLTAALAQTGAVALVAVAPENVAYVTGFRRAAAMRSRRLPACAVFAPAGTALVVPAADAAAAVVDAAVEVDHLAPYGRVPVDLARASAEARRRLAPLVERASPSVGAALAQALATLGLRRGRLALDDDALSARDAEALRACLAGFTVMPATPALETARSVKGPWEIECVGRALSAAEESLDAVLALLRPGVTEREAAVAFEHEARRRGATTSWAIVAFGDDGAVPAPWPGERALRVGDLVRLDVGCHVHGYHGRVARMAAMGPPDHRRQAMFDAVHAALEAAIDAVAPGGPAAAAHHASVTAVREAGLAGFDPDHVGHGVGLAPAEPPYLDAGAAVLEPAMVLCIQGRYYAPGDAGIELAETVLVAQGGARSLNRSHRALVLLD